jgi:hypothetical protein
MDTRWNVMNPRIHPQVVTGPWKHLVFGHPARDDGSVKSSRQSDHQAANLHTNTPPERPWRGVFTPPHPHPQ